MMYRTISIVKYILQKVEQGKGDYGVHNIHTSELCVHDAVLGSHAKILKKEKNVSPLQRVCKNIFTVKSVWILRFRLRPKLHTMTVRTALLLKQHVLISMFV